jgi:hypothetical protein
MSADLISDDFLLIYTKGSKSRIPESVTYNEKFNNHVRDNFITRLTE